ncbi:MAG TPA: winged helix-turn-helix domain-containing protein [Candidatus Angelobacter sp.]|nr:winged helix-turn-helix domain-containing protein [Candidatus Angelobacter sp.]
MPRTKPHNLGVELDLGRYELRRSGHRVKLEKKPMELLIFLVGRREQMVSREDIVRKLWRSNPFIDTERNLNNIVRKIRTALGDNSDKPRFVETVVGKGYRFIGPLRVIDAQYPRADLAPSAAGSTRPEHAIERGERSSLAVMPLALWGKATGDRGLCLGFADALVSRLGNLRDIDVLPTSAVLNLPPDSPPSDIAARLGIRFVVRGGIQASKGQWHLSLELFDTYLQGARWKRKSELDESRLFELETEIAKQIAGALNRPLVQETVQQRPRYSRNALAYAEFMSGYRLSASGDAAEMEKAIHHLTNAVTRDPAFALAHATLSLACAKRHFEYDPASVWLEKAEFHCQRALELEPELPEGYVARAFLVWGPSKNFQHLEAITALKRAITLQANLPHAYSRLGTILAHVGLLDHAAEMFERGRPFHPQKAVSHSIAQVYLWKGEYELARETIAAWRKESPSNKYALHFAVQPPMMVGDWKTAQALVDEALRLAPEDPLVISTQGALYALMGKVKPALDCMTRACANPKSFGHAHHTHYQVACILALTGQPQPAFEWLERSVGTGFACWPFFLKDLCLESLRGLPEFELLISSLQAKYPDHLGLL